MTRVPVLIVDDNPANLKVARFSLESQGFDVRTAADGDEMTMVLREFRPRLILMDLQLPGADGLELTKRLRDDPNTRDIVIVAVTAYAMKGDREKAMAAGCDGYLTKPIDPILLPEQVAEHLGQRRPPPQLSGPRPKHQNRPAPSPSVAVVKESPPQILVVEDNPSTRKLFCVTLETAGYEVFAASDGKTALDTLTRRQPDLIVQDLVLPDMDGLELLQRLRERLGDDRVPIICVSGFLSRLDEARAIKGGFSQVLVKPVDPLELLDVVNTHLGRPVISDAVEDGRLVLVVDDDPLQRKLAQVWLSKVGFNVLVAVDGVTALEIARQQHPVAIVSDVLMPRMDGFSLCLAVRRDPQLREIPVILTSSAYVELADSELADRVGASALLLKTGGLEPMAQALTAALERPSPVAPVESFEVLEEEHSRRAFWQLERLIQQNGRLMHRSSLQQAQLVVLAGVADALARNIDVDGVLGDVLASCLDMAGISKGALYLMESDRLRLKHQIGFSTGQAPELQRVFGFEEALGNVARSGRVSVVPSDEFSLDLIQKMIVAGGVTSFLLVPVSWGAISYGLLVLGGRSAEISGADAVAFARVLGAQLGQAIGLANTFKKLVASEHRYRTLTDHANDAIAVLIPDGNIVEVNRRFTEVLGCPAEEIVGRRLSEFVTMEPGHGDSCGGEGLVRTGQMPRVEIRKPNGDVSFVEFSNAPVEVDGIQLIYAIGRDVTEQMKAQAQLMAADRMASVGTLAAGVAHEINNPLAAVMANLDCARKGLDELAKGDGYQTRIAELRECLTDGHDAADRVRGIVKDLKIFSRAEEDRREPVDTREVMESILRMALNEIRHRARLVTSYGNVPLVNANESRLGQVFLNLVVNAAQAIPEGNADRNEIRVTTSTDLLGRVVIEIRDTGPGIAPEMLRKLFTPFFTTKPAGVGTGLGLTICQRIIKDFGGEITVMSRVGEGTAFRLILPAANAIAQEGAVTAPAQIQSRGGRVLLVDDDQMIGRVIQRILGEHHEVTAVTSAAQALNLIRCGQRYDLILSDIMMPVITGMDFFDRLQEAVPEQAARMVFMTGGVFTARAREFLDRVPNARIDKPFKFVELQTFINQRLQLAGSTVC